MVAQSIKNGSVVKIPTAILFEEWAEMLEQLAYNIRTQCYGVVKNYSTRGGIRFTGQLEGCLIWGTIAHMKSTKRERVRGDRFNRGPDT